MTDFPLNVLKDGSVFVGGTKNNQPDGTGWLIKPDGTKLKGHFINGRKHGPWAIIEENSKTICDFNNGIVHGNSSSYFENNKKILIQKYNNGNHLESDTYNADGRYTREEFKNDKHHGKVTILFKDGNTHEFMYENGEKIKHPKSNDVEGASGKITEQSQKLVEQMKQNYLEKLVIIQDFTKWTLPDDVMIEIRKLKN